MAQETQAVSDAASARSGLTQNISDVHGLGSALGFSIHALASAAPTAALIAAADGATGGAAVPLDGALGGSILRTFGKSAIENGAGRLVAAGVPEAAASSQATDAVAQAIGNNIARAGVGTLATAAPTIGNLLQNQQASGGHTDLLSAVALGLPDALLNTVGPGGALVHGFELAGGNSALLRAGGTVAGNAVKQGAVAVGQTGIEQASDASVGANPYQSPDGFDQLAQAFAGGALVGGGMGAVGALGIHNEPQLGQAQLDPMVQQAQANQAAQAAQAQAPAPQPMLALPAPAPAPTIPVDSQGRAFLPSSALQQAGQRYNDQQVQQIAAQHQAALPTVQGPPGTQGDLLPNAPQQVAPQAPTPAAITAPQGDLFPTAPTQTPPPAGQMSLPLEQSTAPKPPAAPAAPPVSNDLFPAAPEARGGPDSTPVVQGLGVLPKAQAAAHDASIPTTGTILHTLQAAAIPTGGKLLPSTSGLVNLASSLSQHLMSGDIDAAQAVLDDHRQAIEANRSISAKGIAQNSAALDAAQQVINQAADKVTAQQARIHAGERDEAQGLGAMVQGKTSQDLVRQAIDLHSTGKASLEDVRAVTQALVARKFAVARKLVGGMQEKTDGVPSEEGLATPAPASAGPAEPADQQVEAQGRGGEVAQPTPQAVAGRGPAEGTQKTVVPLRTKNLSPLQERLNESLADGKVDPQEHAGLSRLLQKDPAHPSVKAALDTADLNDRIGKAVDADKITDDESQRLQKMVDDPAQHGELRDRLAEIENPAVDDALTAAVKRSNAKTDTRVKNLQDIADEGHRSGALEASDHAEVSDLLNKGGDDNISQAQAILASAQRRTASARRRGTDDQPTGMAREDVQKVVDETGFNNQGPKVNVVQHAADLPAHLREVGQTAKGIYENGTVHLIADNHSTPADAKATLFHEALGHYGLAKQFGSKLDEVMGDIYKTNPTIRRAADAWMSENPSMYRDSPHLQARAAEEALAQMQESGPAKPYPLQAAFRRVLGVVRDIGRRMGLVKNYSDGDVVRILQAATKAARSAPGDALASAPRFRSTTDSTRQYADRLKERSEIAGRTAVEKVQGAIIHAITNRQLRDGYEKDLPATRTLVDIMSRKQTDISNAAQRAVAPLDQYRHLTVAEREATSKLLVQSREMQDLASEPGSALAAEYAKLSPAGRATYDQFIQHFKDDRATIVDAFKSAAEDLAADAPKAAAYIESVIRQFGHLKVYVPYVREGEHIAVAQHANGDRIVRAFKSIGEADKFASDISKEGYDTKRFRSDEYGMQGHAGFEEFGAKLQDSIESKASALERAGDRDAADLLRGQVDEIRQIMLRMLPEGSIMKKTIKAEGVAGHIDDMGEALNISAKRNARMIANLKSGAKARAALQEIRADARAKSKTNSRLDQVYRQLKENYESSLSGDHTPIQNFINNVGYVYQLAFSPAFTFMHFMQTPLVTTQMLGAFHGQARSWMALGTAMKDISGRYFGSHGVAGDIQSRFSGNGPAHDDITAFGKTAGEKLMLSHLDAQGHFGDTDARQRLDELVGAGGLSAAGRNAMVAASYMPHHTERYNRIITALAAYRMDQEKTVAPLDMDAYNRFRQTFKDDAIAQAMTPGQYASTMHAEDMVTRSHTDYNQANTSGLFSKPGGFVPKKIMFQFKKYQQNMMYELVNNAVKAFKDHDPNQRSVARRTFLGLMATHFLAAGVMGMPLYGVATGLMDIYNQFVGNHDEPFDADASFREMMTKEFGAPMAQAIDSGLLFSLPIIKNILPADVTNRIGLGDLFSPGNPTGEINSDNFLQYVGGMVLGSTGSLIGQVFDAYQDTRDGNTWRAAEDIMPKAMRDVSKAARFATYGVRSTSGQLEVAPEDITDSDVFAQAMGFQPQKVERAEAAREYLYTEQQQLQDRQTALTQEYLRAVTEGGDVGAALDNIQQFNKDRYQANQSNHAIKPEALQKAVQTYYQSAAMLRGGVSLKGQDIAGFSPLTEFSQGMDEGRAQ
jgi:hypothetical protein